MIKAKVETKIIDGNQRNISGNVAIEGITIDIVAETGYLIYNIGQQMAESGVLAEGVTAGDLIDCVAEVAREIFKNGGEKE